MAYAITIENKYGDQLQLTNNHNYITKATGLSPVNSNIVTASVANYGGERYVSSRQQKRNIVLTIYVNEPVETNRINLYKYIKSDDYIKLYYKNATRDVYIEGYVESFEADLFEQTQTAQISIICPQPQFKDVDGKAKQMSANSGMLSFPFFASDDRPVIMGEYNSDSAILIVNESDDDIGFIYSIHCNGTVINPIIYDEDTMQYFKLNGIYSKDSVISINTLNGHKGVTCDWRGHVSNIINDLDPSSTWLQLRAGYNHMIQTADTGSDNMISEIVYNNEYEGV